jgi:hypothetical protein
MRTDDIEIDARVKRLVIALNTIPGIDTFSSCGGHVAPSGSQVAKDRFNVNFDIQRTARGWRALQLIQFAIDKSVDRENMTITPWTEGTEWEPGSLHFELRGRRFADPDTLASIVEALLGELGGKP